MFLTACSIAIFFGILSIVDSKFVWSLHEVDAKLLGFPVRFVPNWELLMKVQGVVLIVLGLIGVWVRLTSLS